ncbi:hypothetical protein Taro_005522 [Colocasia esculenta]|uniref:Uncharacterized protein n=1 Tax=Colocasia esculenta TaxID=4460 RepID=A0A843TY48_COLES|nr:hypothetical protein [Colocasia esculenta]
MTDWSAVFVGRFSGFGMIRARGSSSWELGVGRVAEAVVASCVVSSSESECCELLYPSELRVVFCKSSGFSPRLLHVVLVVVALSLCGDELSLLPVGLSLLQSAWAFSIKVLCPRTCVWLPRWPACLIVIVIGIQYISH